MADHGRGRGAGADSSSSIAYLTQATAGAVPALTNRQASLGGDAGFYRIFAMRLLARGSRRNGGRRRDDRLHRLRLDTPTITPPGLDARSTYDQLVRQLLLDGHLLARGRRERCQRFELHLYHLQRG